MAKFISSIERKRAANAEEKNIPWPRFSKSRSASLVLSLIAFSFQTQVTSICSDFGVVVVSRNQVDVEEIIHQSGVLRAQSVRSLEIK